MSITKNVLLNLYSSMKKNQKGSDQIECIFLSQGRHYDSFPDFTPSSDASWCLTDSQHWEIQVKTWVFTLKMAGKFEFQNNLN